MVKGAIVAIVISGCVINLCKAGVIHSVTSCAYLGLWISFLSCYIMCSNAGLTNAAVFTKHGSDKRMIQPMAPNVLLIYLYTIFLGFHSFIQRPNNGPNMIYFIFYFLVWEQCIIKPSKIYQTFASSCCDVQHKWCLLAFSSHVTLFAAFVIAIWLLNWWC